MAASLDGQGKYKKGGFPTETLISGFANLLKQCLRTRREDNVLIIYDETFAPLLAPLQSVLIAEQLQTAFLAIPRAYQLAMISWWNGPDQVLDLPRCIEAACGEATVILSCLAPDLATQPVRSAVLNTFRAKGCRFAHIPGLSEEILEILTRSPIDDILRSADAVAWALGEARTTTLRSYDEQGRVRELTMELDGWENEPLMSTGVIFEGSWGNVPPGEVFCCPDPSRVNGEVCINGSIPGSRLGKGDFGVIVFEGGRAIDCFPKQSPVAMFLSEQKALASGRNDSSWNVFAELGVGLNPAIHSLTGNSLLDEKALGTIHIAIGNNHSFGHGIKSHIHADMVTTEPDLLLEGELIVDRGRLRLDTIQSARRNHKIRPVQFESGTRISLREAKLEIIAGRVLRRLYSAERVGHVFMTEEANAAPIRDLMRLLPDGISLTHGRLRAAIPSNDLDRILALLHHYRVLRREPFNANSVTND